MAAPRRRRPALAAAALVALAVAPLAAGQASDAFLLGCAAGAADCAPVLAAQPPPVWVAHLDTTAGRVSVTVNTSWAPAAAQRFYALTLLGYGVGGPAFRVLNLGAAQRFVAQLGVRGAPDVDDGASWGVGWGVLPLAGGWWWRGAAAQQRLRPPPRFPPPSPARPQRGRPT